LRHARRRQPLGEGARDGLKLFNRQRQRLVIIEAGRAYLAIVRDAFDRIADGTERLLQRQSGGALTVQHLAELRCQVARAPAGPLRRGSPGDRIYGSAHRSITSTSREDIDLAIRHGDGTASGLHVTCFRAEERFPVCSPKLLEGRDALRKPSDLNRFILLHVNDRQGWSQWLSFAEAAESTPRAARSSTRRAWRSMPQSTASAWRWRTRRWRGLGPDRRPPGQAIRYRNAGVLRLLDRLLAGAARLAISRSSRNQ
jgi:DNA-binding transcriptional LysR family regulator